jgi:hypothetical protein
MSARQAEKRGNNKQCHRLESSGYQDVGIKVKQLIHHASILSGDGMLSIDWFIQHRSGAHNGYLH